MHTLTLLSALLTWSEQAAVLICAGALASLTIASPKARLAMWHALLLALLFLPLIEPWKAQPLLLPANAGATATAFFSAAAAAAPSAGFHWRAEYWLWLIAAVAALRLLLFSIGLLRLRHYRINSQPLPEPPLRFASNAAAWYSSESIGGPVTYGWRHPVILLPEKALDLPATVREAIECHELIHVYRGDWLFVLAESLIRSLLWFHPAVLFALSRINLAREQAVDREAVKLLKNRDGYLDALVAVAAYRVKPDFAPAFLRKRHLLARVESVVKEIDMSRSRVAFAVAAVSSIVPLALGAAIWLFPFTAPLKTFAQTAPDSPGVIVDAGAILLHRAPVRTPEASTSGGKVILEANLDARGDVTDARVISGPQELRNAALSSVLQWHYEPGPALAQISIQFAPAAAAASAQAPMRGVAPRGATPAAQATNRTLQSIRISGISPEAERSLRGELTVHEGDPITEQDMLAVTAAVRNFDSHLRTAFTLARDGATTLQISPVAAPLAVTGGSASAVNLPPLPAGVYRPGGDVSNPIPTSRPQPQYTEEARQARWGGTVLLSLVVGEDGVPRSIQVIKPLGFGLDEKAIEAVSQWRFRPGMKGGVAVPVAAQIEVTFRPM